MHAIFAVIPILSFQFDECRFSAPREAVVDVADAVQLVINAGAGNLKVEGKAGLRQARIRGTACASDRSLLDEIELSANRVGNEIRINVNDQDLELRSREYARLNVVIEVPEGMAANIEDGSGDAEFSGLGALQLEDGSGDIVIHDISGAVSITDGSGFVELKNVQGDVTVEDGSGQLELTDIDGTLDLRDGSGEILVARVIRNVLISDSSGDIEVDVVGGNLTVRTDTNGDIDYRGVRGQVRVPAGREHTKSRFRLLW
ncbi:MAG: DUF4097 family beta strand repeat-containing protein [Longimicrobiales bacterium]